MAHIFLEIFNLSISACWLIAAVLVVRAVFAKRMPKWISCCLWGLVAVRLLLPFSLESEISLVPNRQIVMLESGSENIGGEEDITPDEPITESAGNKTDSAAPEIIIGEAFSAPEIIIGEASPAPAPDVQTGTVNGTQQDTPTDKAPSVSTESTPIQDTNAGDTILTESVADEARGNGISEKTLYILGTVWFCGFALLLCYSAFSYILLKRRVALSIPCGKGVRKGENVESPFVFGLFKPRIYLPFGLSLQTEQCVIAHERAHLKRMDHLIKPFAFLLLSVYWFNPLVWVAYILLCRDIEYACDERVIKELAPEERKAYAYALLECAVAHRRITACPVAFGETGVKSRVKNTMSYRKPAFWLVVCGIFVCVTVAALFMTTVKSDTPDEAISAESAESAESVEEITEESTEESIEESTEESTEEPQTPPFAPETLEYIDGLFAAKQIEYDETEKYAGCYRYESDDHSVSPILFIPKTVLYNLRVYSLEFADDWAESGDMLIESILFEAERITDTKPLLADIQLVDAFAVRGISFTDENGRTHFYKITDSAVDDRLLINEFTPAKAEESGAIEYDDPDYRRPLYYVDGLFDVRLLEYADVSGDDDFIRLESDEQSDSNVLIRPKTEIYNLEIFTIPSEWTLTGKVTVGEIIYRVDKVTADKPLIASFYVSDTHTASGFSFTDASGQRYYYELTLSSVDGRLYNGRFYPEQKEENKLPETEQTDEETNQSAPVPLGTLGNKHGNSRVAKQGSTYYYADGGYITAISDNGNTAKRVLQINSGYIYNLNIAGDWMYFSVKESSIENCYIAKARTDGSGFTKLLQIGDIYEMLVVNDRIYFIPVCANIYEYLHDGSLYSMSVNGGAVTEIHGGFVSSLYADENYIYFIYEDLYVPMPTNIYRMNHDGSGKAAIWKADNDIHVNSIAVDGGRVYFGVFDEIELGKFKFVSIDNNGNGYTEYAAIDSYSYMIDVCDGKLYYHGPDFYYGETPMGNGVPDPVTNEITLYNYGLIEMDLATKELTFLHVNAYESVFYADNGLVFVPENYSVAVINTETDETKRISVK